MWSSRLTTFNKRDNVEIKVLYIIYVVHTGSGVFKIGMNKDHKWQMK